MSYTPDDTPLRSRQPQIEEIMRLAGLLATRRVRKFAVACNISRNPKESKEVVERGAINAAAALRKYAEQVLG